jgi:chitodextrinase
MKICFYFIITLFLFSTQMYSQIAGDIQNIESGLQSRTDVLYYEGFSSTNWGDRWDMADEGGNTTMNANGFDGNCLNIFLKQGSYGASGSGNTAMSTFLKSFSGVQSLHEELYFRYYIYIDPNFDFSQGGKIPGMASHALYGAGSHPNGDDGWTARYMWNSYGELYLYGYFPGEGGWGTNIYCDYTGKRARLERGKWHCIEQYIKLNSVTGSTGNADGKCYTWLDGTLSMKEDDIVYRTVVNDAGKEFGIYASVFFGGADADWTPEYDTYIRLDNMVLAKNYIGPRTGTNVLTAPNITTSGGTFTSPVNVSITATSGDEIRYTTNGSEPTHWSQKYTNPVTLSKNATLKARAFNSSNPRYSSTVSVVYTVNTTAGTTTTTKSASADAYFRNGSYENTNYGSEVTMELKSGSFSYDRKAAIKFPLSGINAISSAKLRLNAASISASTIVGIFEMTDEWTETELTSRNAPPAGDLVAKVTASVAGWLEFDVTNYISSKVSQGATEISFYIMALNYETEQNSASIKSRTATSGQPELVVINAEGSGTIGDTNAPSAPTGLTSSNITENGFTLSWSASTDNVGVTGYDIYKDGSLIGNTSSTSYTVNNLTAGTTYNMTIKARDAASNVSVASTALNVTTTGAVTPTVSSPIMYEPFDYTTGTNNPDSDGGLNGGNGLPFTNDGGSPTGTGTGLYGNWGSNLSIANGLTYTGLQTSGGSANPTVAGWGNGAIRTYRNMTTDPYINLRYYSSATSNKAGFSYDGTTAQTYYISFLAKVTAVADNNFRLSLGATGDNNGGSGSALNFYVVSTGTGKWTLSPNGSNATSTAVCTANEVALLLVKMEFTGGNVNFSLWKNPPLSGSLPTADATATMTFTQFNGFLGFNYRPASATAMYFDELRFGKTADDVLPDSVLTEVPSINDVVKVFPTICTTEVKVEALPGETIVLSDIAGNALLTAKVITNQTVISLEGFKSGLYFVNVQGEALYTAKIIKK